MIRFNAVSSPVCLLMIVSTRAAGFLTPSVLAAESDRAKAGSSPVRVMTCNLRHAQTGGPNPWPARRPLVPSLIAEVRPDLIGTQEGLFEQRGN